MTHRADDFSRLRDYCRGYVCGASKALCSEFVAIELEARALIALDMFGVSQAQVRAFFSQARHEVRLTAPDGTSDHDLRALAAQRILVLLEARTRREMSAAPAPRAA